MKLVVKLRLADGRLWHFAPLVVRPLSVRRDHGAESAAAQPARPNVTTLPVALRLSATASTWAAPGVEGGALLRRPVVALIDPGDAGAAAADVIEHRFRHFEPHAEARQSGLDRTAQKRRSDCTAR